MNRQEPRLLVSTYQCGLGMGSVSQIGWYGYSRLAQRLPATAVTFGGPAEIVDDAVGRALPDSRREAMVGGLVEGFRDVAAHPEVWCARECYGWDARVDAAVARYRRLLGYE